MKNLKHTPGPWKLEQDPTEMVLLGNKGEHIASIPIPADCCLPEDRDNARLITAAPEMLEALRGLVAELESVKVPAPGLIHAKAAIAKAEGKDDV